MASRLWLPRAISANNRGGFGVLGWKNRGLTGVKQGINRGGFEYE